MRRDMGLFDDPVGFFNGGTQGPFGQMMAGALSGPGLQNFYDPNRSFAQNALDPRGIEQAMNIGAGFAMPIKAYHGSPYDFTKFDASKIGTGEGAQAYGHGLYFAESPEVAQNYRDQLSQWTANGKPLSDDLNIALGAYNGNVGDLLAFRQDQLARWLSSGVTDTKGIIPQLHQDIRQLEALQKKNIAPLGKMYEVNINAEPDQFLHWDKPLSEQPETVRAAMDRLHGELGPDLNIMTAAPNPTGQTFYQGLGQHLGGVREQQTPAGSYDLPYSNEGAASRALGSAGIPGIRYLDQGSRGSGQGTSNYVVFNPEIVQILKKYGLAGMTLGGGSMFMSGNQQ